MTSGNSGNKVDLVETLIVNTARIAHEVNRAYCEALGDHSQPRWHEAPLWQRDSAINGVRFRIKNPTATPEDMHNNWMREKLVQGWMYGEVKDATKKTHPCMMRYDELPLEQRVKDHLFSAVVTAML